MRSLNQEQVRQKCEDLGCTLIGTYVNNATKIQFLCRCGTVFIRSPATVLYYKKVFCLRCSKIPENYKIELNTQYGNWYTLELISDRYQRYKVKCLLCDRIFKRSKSQLLGTNGLSSCRECKIKFQKISNQTKLCSLCLKYLPLSDFNINSRTSTGYDTRCRICRQITEVCRTHNISVTDYIKMIELSNNCCYICGENANKQKFRLNVDHCHKTDKIRGLLCSNCNTALGLVKEDINTLEKMINYIKNEGHNYAYTT